MANLPVGLPPMSDPPPPQEPENRTLTTIVFVLMAVTGILLLGCLALLFVYFRTEPEPPKKSAPIPTIQYRNQSLPILEHVAKNHYDPAAFTMGEDGRISYPLASVGVDVSSYQGEIDWTQVAESGIDFAMIRLGYRGYATGKIVLDTYFTQNIQGALDAGLSVGVYFFSQARDAEEAREEADFVLEQIEGYSIRYPVAFDWEFIADVDDARTNFMLPDEVTQCAIAFCNRISAAGYAPLVYFNQDLGYLTYRLNQLSNYDFWLAEYRAVPSFYYHFDIWQYTYTATVPGIAGSVDLNLDLRS